MWLTWIRYHRDLILSYGVYWIKEKQYMFSSDFCKVNGEDVGKISSSTFLYNGWGGKVVVSSWRSINEGKEEIDSSDNLRVSCCGKYVQI